MNRVGLMDQVDNMLGNDVMNPQAKNKWMDKPTGDSSPLVLLKLLDSLSVKQVVSLSESILNDKILLALKFSSS